MASQVDQQCALVPVVVYGDPGPVRAVVEKVRAAAPGRLKLDVMVWLRRNEDAGRPRQWVQKAMTVYYGPGDIEAGRVCASPSPSNVRWHHAFPLRLDPNRQWKEFRLRRCAKLPTVLFLCVVLTA